MPNMPVKFALPERLRGLLHGAAQKDPVKRLPPPVPLPANAVTAKAPQDGAEDIPTAFSLSSGYLSLATTPERYKNDSPASGRGRDERDEGNFALSQDMLGQYRSGAISTSNISESTLVSSPFTEPSVYLLRDAAAWQQTSPTDDPTMVRPASSGSRASAQFRVQKLASKWAGRSLGEDFEDETRKDIAIGHEYKGKAWGKLKDDVAKAGKDRWTVACIKATSRFCAAPDEKQLRLILTGLREGGRATDRDMPLGAILHQLGVRLDSSDWTVVLKTQIVFHTIFRSGNQHFVDYLAYAMPDMFENSRFDDMSAGGVLHTPFIKSYAIYLQRWLVMRARTMFPPTKTTDPSVKNHFQQATAEELLEDLPDVMNLVSSLLEFELNSRIRKSPVANAALFLLLRDQSAIIVALKKGVDRLVELFYNLSREQAVKAMAVYGRYRQLMGELRFVIERLQRVHPGWHVPLDISAESLAPEMQRYIDDEPLSFATESATLETDSNGRLPDRVVSTEGRKLSSNLFLPHARTPFPAREPRRRRVLSHIEVDNSTIYSL